MMSGARRRASFHLFFKYLPRGTTGEQTNQLYQAQIGILVKSAKLQVGLEEPTSSLPQLIVTTPHLRAIKPRLQEQWPHDWRKQA